MIDEKKILSQPRIIDARLSQPPRNKSIALCLPALRKIHQTKTVAGQTFLFCGVTCTRTTLTPLIS